MARLLLVAPPFSGHLHPMLAMARRLAAEHDVLFVSTESACGAITAAGLRSQAILHGADAAIRAIAEPPYPVRSNPLLLNRQLKANVALMRRFHDELDAVCDAHRPALIVADFVLPVAGLVGSARGIPWWTSLPSPSVLATRDGPPPYLGGLAPLRGLAGRARDAAGRAFVHAFKRAVFALYRRELAWTGLRSPYRADGSEVAYSGERIVVPGIREIEFAQRWPAAVRFVGPLCYTPAPPDPDALDGTPGPRVLVTLGTLLRARKDAMADATRAAARRLPGVTFHFSDGDASAAARAERDGNFVRSPFVSYDAHVRRYDLVVHHAGTGIANRCLVDGVPALVHPQDYDQFDHAARLVHAGVARRLTGADALAGAVAAALADAPLRAACSRFARIAAGYDAAETIALLVRERLAG